MRANRRLPFGEALLVALFFAAALGAGACETVLTAEELADRARAVEFLGPFNPSYLGWNVNKAGDLDGDGFDDFAITAAVSYEVYIVFGRSDWTTARFNFSAPTAFKIGGPPYSKLGNQGLASGDYNGDGRSDLFINSFTLGKAFCVYGQSSRWSSSFKVSDIESGSIPGFVVTGGPSPDLFTGNAGDMNGDGIEDLLVSAFNSSKATSSFVVFGAPGATRSAFDLSTVDGTNGFALVDGEAYLGNGRAYGQAGDINGDGLADLVFGSYKAMGGRGRAYVLFARNVSASGKHWPALINLTTDIDGDNGFIVEGPSVVQLGMTAMGAGDVNGDGYADIFIGSFALSSAAGAWVVFGHPVPWTSPLIASQLDGTNGFRFKATGSEYWGYSGGGAGDVNGDGFDDIVIGAYKALDSFGVQTGAAAILFGHGGTWPAALDRNDVAGSVGLFINGPSNASAFGISAQAAGDVNGDGLADIVVGDPDYLSHTGYAALVFGVAKEAHCAVCSNTTDECFACVDGYFLNSSKLCEACEDEHCIVCITASVCSICVDGFVLNGSVCESEPPFVSSSSSSSSSAFEPFFSSSSSSSSTAVHGSSVVIINFNENISDPTELQEEIASVLGIDAGLVSVVVISPTEVEVTIIGSEETAQRLVDIINNGGAGSDGSGLGLLRKATDAHIRKDADGGSSGDDGVDPAPRVALLCPLLFTAIAIAAAHLL